MLTPLAAMVSGIVIGKSCQLPTIARKAPDGIELQAALQWLLRWQLNITGRAFSRGVDQA